MSRTYRKRNITDEKSLVKYVNDHIDRVRRRRRWERYMTEGGRIAYEKAMAEYEIEYYQWLYHGWKTGGKRPVEPYEYEFHRIRITHVEYDHDQEVKEATEEYNGFKRDGRFYESNLNRSYKKYCADELRRVNRELARKIIKDDDSWEDKPYPDTYLGKKHIWDYF